MGKIKYAVIHKNAASFTGAKAVIENGFNAGVVGENYVIIARYGTSKKKLNLIAKKFLIGKK